MDIHKPKPIHGWRDFLKEVGVIVLGVLIVVDGPLDASDEPVLEPRPGEVRLWRQTRLQALAMLTTSSGRPSSM